MRDERRRSTRDTDGKVVRRNNAPVRPPRRPATTVPDLLLALAVASWTMAIVFFVASFFNDNVTAGEAGKVLARFFAGALTVTGLFLFLLSYGLLRDERARADHYVVPSILGLAIGGIESFMFLWPAGSFLFAPFVLLVFVLRPVRRHIARMLQPLRGMTG